MNKDLKFILYTSVIMLFLVSILHFLFFISGACFFLWTYPIMVGGIAVILAFCLFVFFPLAEYFNIL